MDSSAGSDRVLCGIYRQDTGFSYDASLKIANRGKLEAMVESMERWLTDTADPEDTTHSEDSQ